jgi:hypothetical protein
MARLKKGIVKGKVKLSLCLTKQHAMKTYWGSGGIAARILELGTRWRWSASLPGRFTPRERSPGTYWIGGWVGPRAVLDAVVERKILSPRRESKPRTPIVQPIAQRYTDWTIMALQKKLYMMKDTGITKSARLTWNSFPICWIFKTKTRTDLL